MRITSQAHPVGFHQHAANAARAFCCCAINRLAGILGLVLSVCCLFAGCGTTREQNATYQLVMSEAVDRSIQNIDFRPLSEQKVYLDNSYLRHVKGEGFVNSEYVTSALRQQIVAAGCLIQDTPQEADIIIEARLGVLGADDHRVTFGIPENNLVSSTLRLIPEAPQLPAIPEIALARREAREASAKVVAFAYHRESREPIWQSGVKHSLATARDTWILGIGPFQAGTIRDETKLAGSRLRFKKRSATGSPLEFFERPSVDYSAEVRFQNGKPIFGDEIPSGMMGPELQPGVPSKLPPVQIAEEIPGNPTIADKSDQAPNKTR